MAKLAACDTGRKAVVADTDRIVLERVRKVVFALGHGANEDADGFFWADRFNVISDANNFSVEAECYFAAIEREMVCYGVFDDLEQLLVGVRRADAQFVKKLDHKSSEAFESSRYADGRANLDENAFGRMDIDLELAGFIDRRIEESEKALYSGVSGRLLGYEGRRGEAEPGA